MNSDPVVVPSSALTGKRVAISVSESGDLARLGLHSAHLELAVAELTRAILFAGGTVVYGGKIEWGFTRIVLDEVERYGAQTGAFEHYVPYSEHFETPLADLRKYESRLSVKARLLLLDAAGRARSVSESATADFARGEVDAKQALTQMRQLTTTISDARVVLGGKVSGFEGALPGVAEEAVLTATLGKALYVAGGFGGSATLVGRLARPDLYAWLPQGLPADVTGEIETSLSEVLPEHFAEDGLSNEERALLAQTNRPSDVATLAALGLSRLARAQ
jgi:hypothetical protein